MCIIKAHSMQAQRAIPEIRKTKGCIMWVSSGAARNAYQGWSAYASSKAAVNSLSTCLAFEEKDITSVTIEPGRVDTDMQKHIRSFGKDSMDKSQHDNFIQAFEQGQLLKPEQPGHVIARFVAEPDKTLSGQNLKCVSHPIRLARCATDKTVDGTHRNSSRIKDNVTRRIKKSKAFNSVSLKS